MPSPFPPIEDFAFLSDCHTGALVAARRRRSAGCACRASTRPACSAPCSTARPATSGSGPSASTSRRRGPTSPAPTSSSTTWNTPGGWVVVRDALTMGPRHGEDTVTPHTRPPADDDADHTLVRTATCIDGRGRDRARLRAGVRLRPHRRDLGAGGRRPARGRRHRGRPDHPAAHRPGARHRGRSGPGPPRPPRRRAGRTARCPGPRAWPPRPTSARPTPPWPPPATFWRTWMGTVRTPSTTATARRIERSALTIKGLTYMPTGATVAALTTSLPETPGGERNWDYRYTWMRDSTFTLQALHYLDLDWEADEFMQFVRELEPVDDGGLQIMYGIDGRRDLTETTRDDLSGYAGARPVRVGNGAWNQRQNDVYGAVLDSILLHTRRSQRLPRGLWPLVQSQAACATAVWRNPDQGIWEARGEPQHYVSSKLMCWVALDRAAQLAGIRGDADRRGDLAVDGRRDPGRHPRPRSRRPGRAAPALRHRRPRRVDAAGGHLRVPPRRRRAPAGHGARHRRRADRARLRAALPHRRDRRRPVSGKEGTFLICSFWLVSALAIIGEEQRARDLMDRLLRIASPLGLYAEEFDTDTAHHLGNFPQAFSHLALIEAAGRIILLERLAGAAHERPETTTTSSSSAPEPAGAPWPATWRRRASASCCSSGATGCRASRPTGRPATCSSTAATSRPTPGTTTAGKAFQPQVHYFVGGATKLYGAALYRLRAEDFGELHHVDGLSPAWPISYTDMEPYYTQAEQLYQVHGARGEDPTEPPASADYPFPALHHEPRIQQLADDLAAAGYHPFHAPCGVLLDEANMPYSTCVRCGQCDGFPCPLHAKSDAEVLRRAPRAGAPERHAGHRRHRAAADHRRLRSLGHRRGGRARRRGRDVTARASSWCPAGPPTPPSCCSPRRTTGTRTGWPTGPTRSAATTCSTTARRSWRCRASPTRRCSRRRWASTTSTSPPTSSTTRSATSRWSASRRPRCTGARSRSRPSWPPPSPCATSPSHAVDFWLSTEDLPRPENRVTLAQDGNIQLAYEETNHKASQELYHKLRSMLGHLGMHPDHLVPRHAYLKTAIPVAGCAHQAGTCRFGADPATSVVDTDCRAHEVDNLYVVDTSIFPSIGAVNPALTAMANALRVGDHLLDRLGARMSDLAIGAHVLAVDPVPWARAQMAFTLASHIILVPLGVSWACMTLVANWRAIKRDDRDALLLAQRWSKYMAVTFAVGAVDRHRPVVRVRAAVARVHGAVGRGVRHPVRRRGPVLLRGGDLHRHLHLRLEATPPLAALLDRRADRAVRHRRHALGGRGQRLDERAGRVHPEQRPARSSTSTR